jgi:hypothetical protein
MGAFLHNELHSTGTRIKQSDPFALNLLGDTVETYFDKIILR